MIDPIWRSKIGRGSASVAVKLLKFPQDRDKDVPTKWRKTYDDDNRMQIGDDEVNTGGNYHKVEDTDGVVVVSGKYISPVLKFPRDRDKDVPHEPPPGIGTLTSDTNKENSQRHAVAGAPVGQVGACRP